MLMRWILVALSVALLSGCQGWPQKEPRQPSWVEGRPQLGVRLRLVTPDGRPELADGLADSVLQVVAVRADSPAQRAGLVPGDRLLRLDGVAVHGMRDSVAVMESKGGGAPLMVTIERDGRQQTVRVELSAKASKAENSQAGISDW